MIRYHDKWMNFLSITKCMNFLSIADYWLQSIVVDCDQLYSILLDLFWFYLARQQEAEMSPILNYEEITPCLRDVTKEWEDMINDSNRPHIQFSHQSLLKCVQQGKSQLTTCEWFSYSLFCKICCNMATHVLVEFFWEVLMVDKKLLQ